MFEISGIPYTGIFPFNTVDFLWFMYAFWQLAVANQQLREYNLKVIEEIPNLQKEFGVSEPPD